MRPGTAGSAVPGERTHRPERPLGGRGRDLPSAIGKFLGRGALAFGGGLALALAFPPFGAGILAVLAPAALMAAIAAARPLTRVVAGFLFGVGFFGLLLLWALRFGFLAWGALVVTESAFAALFAWVAGPLLRRPSLASLGGTSALWVLVMEVARGRVPFGGFPWGSLGYPLVGTPLELVAPLAGGIGVSWLASFVAATSFSVARRGLKQAAKGLVLAATAVAVSMPFAGSSPRGAGLRVAIVQGNVPLQEGPGSPEATARILADHVALTRTLSPGSVDLVVWPEGVVEPAGDPPAAGRPAPDPLVEVARRVDAWLVAGVLSDAGPGRFRNSVVSVSPSGRVAGIYHKQRAVPFGEYVPWRRLLGFIRALDAVPRDMIPGPGVRLLPVSGGRVGTPISYEVAFSRIVRGFATSGAGAIVVATNTSAFGPRAATAEQQFQATRMRALELGLYVVQSAPSGVSAIVDPRGHVVTRSDLYRPQVLRGSIRLGTGSTPFAGVGEGPVVILAVLAALWAYAGPQVRLRRRSIRAIPRRAEGNEHGADPP
ncbi:MAG: apolipoprotein N-acyltransferase [Actinomycetota bacterium]